ncbi:MAG: DMT family transporter [Evtepia sp.]|nr:DMT family transporter [Evtepia sp.]
MKKDFALGCLFIALATLIFSTMEVLLKLPAVAGAFHPMQITVERFLVGGVCLLPMTVWTLQKKGIRLTGADLRFFALTGLLNIPLGMVLYQLAITHGQANVVAVIFSGNPIFVTVLAALLLGELIHWNNLLALAAEVLGILAIVNPFGRGRVSLTSVVLAVLAALFFALYAVLGKKKTAQVGSIVVTCCSFLLGGAELLVLLLVGRTGVGAGLYQAIGLDCFCDVPFFQGINEESLPYFLFIGIVNCAGGYVFHMLAIEKTSATHGSLVFFFKPILAPLMALAVLGEAITPNIGVGIGFFLAGSLLGILPEAWRARRAQGKAEEVLG